MNATGPFKVWLHAFNENDLMWLSRLFIYTCLVAY